jgi:hypothetical protein
MLLLPFKCALPKSIARYEDCKEIKQRSWNCWNPVSEAVHDGSSDSTWALINELTERASNRRPQPSEEARQLLSAGSVLHTR